MRSLIVLALLTFVAGAAQAQTTERGTTTSPIAKKSDDDDGTPKLSLPTEADRVAWQRSGFRLGLGLVYGRFEGMRGAPSGRLLGAQLHAGLRLDADWSLMTSFQYASVSGPNGGLSGLRFAGTLDPTWHVTPSFSLAIGVGFGGIVEGRTNRVDPIPPDTDTSYTFPNAHMPLQSCSGVGVAGLARADYAWVLGPRSQTAVSLEVDGQYTGCVERSGAVEADTAQPIERRQFWEHYGVTLAWGYRVALRVIVLLALVRAIAFAQAPPPDAGVDSPAAPSDAGASADAAPAQQSFQAPVAKGSTDVAYPDSAPDITAPVAVTVKLLVDETGAVAKVDLVSAPQPIFDDAVIAAAKAFTFDPATFGGKPVKVQITFTHTFVPKAPPPPTVVTPESKATAVLRGKLIELGTRKPVTSATITAVVDGTTYTAEGDQTGHFRLALAPGAAKITVYAPSHEPFEQQEQLAARQELGVTYLVSRDRYDPYSITVVGEQRREEVSRITLRGAELQQVPGTFGDPFRVIQALPGVASVVSLLPFPVVRGASPSSTGFEIDGTRVPLLFHLLSGPSVIHPEFIDEIQFYPGGAPAPYGGYTAGIIDGLTRRANKDEHLIDVDLNLLQVGGLIREPVTKDISVTAAARYGFPGFLLSLATNQASLSYWDYQLRVDGGTKANGWTLFSYGARDELDTVAPNADPNDPNPPLAPELILGFHRLDLRYHRTFGKLDTTARIVGGYDRTESMGTDFTIWSADPELKGRLEVDKTLALQAGITGDLRLLRPGANTNAAAGSLAAITSSLSSSQTGSVYFEGIWRPSPLWLIRPGVRGDIYHDDTATKPAFDPRLTVRYKLGERDLPDVAPGSDDAAVWLKGATGIYHQPPRFVVPLPGLDMMPLKYGLLEAWQSSLGVEMPLGARFTLSTEAFYNYMNPTIFDLSTNVATVGTGAQATLIPTSIINMPDPGSTFIDRLTTPQTGRAYGLEFLLRRQAQNGVFGWISYTLSRSERDRDGVVAPYDYDRTHLLNLVLGVPLRRNWDLGLRAQYESGEPATTTYGYNTARTDGYVRFDVRIDKRAVYRSWLLDFYVDITNVALLPEEITPGQTIRYVLPTVGFRGRF